MTEYSAKRATMSRVVERILTPTKRNVHESLAVLPVQTVCQGLQLPDGRLIVVELAKPTTQFAVVHRSGADAIEIVCVRDTEAEAVGDAQALAVQLESLAPKGTLQ